MSNAKCWDCHFWRGSCAKGYKGKVANDDACEEFKPKPEPICDFLRYTL